MAEAIAQAPKPQEELFYPPPGGDLTLKSKDGAEFRVHTVLLGLSSTFFQGMLTDGTKDESVDLGEDSEAVSLMLRYIYPNETPSLKTLREFRIGFEVAQKYDMSGVTRTLEQQFRLFILHRRNPGQLDLILVCEIAKTYGLRDTALMAARMVSIDRCDLRTPAKITELATRSPSSSTTIGLIGAQGARTKIISRALFSFHSHPMRWRVSNRPKYYIMCEDCRMRSEDIGLTHSPPAWLISWASHVYQPLLSYSPAQLPQLFDTRVLEELRMRYPEAVCSECIYEIQVNELLKAKFYEWSAGMKEYIDKQLESLDGMYSL